MGGGQGGCERRIDVFAKIQQKKKILVWGGGRWGWGEGRVGGGVRVDVIEELKFLGKFTQKNFGGGGCVGGGGGGGGSGWWGCQGGYERRIEVFVKIKKKKFFLGGGGGSGVGLGRGGGGGCERRI